MKKKDFLSKLQFQKITVATFSSLKSLKGGTLQGPGTEIVSRNGFTCPSGVCVPIETQDDRCISIVPTMCSRPTNTRTTDDSKFCGATQGDESKIICTETQVIC
ncbi:hypothetical protein [uncultured Kordia sp.]|uniref:hypothetical protein n=1 Tax=uncultured Kordia sp. TaxID=507699 RepID=UPI00260EFD99|nr:hypothetical protein [uncultured Kordia sp.]